MDKGSQQKWESWAKAHPNLLESVERSTDPEAINVILDDLAKKLDLQPGDRLLDVGCGSGLVCSQLGRRHQLDVTGVDFAFSQVKLATQEFPGNGFAQAAAEDIPFVDGAFDKILSYGVFHYVDDWKKAVAGFVRAIEPPGRILIGDLPSRAHKHRLYMGYLKRIPAVLSSLKTLFSKVNYAAGTSHWHWLDLKAMQRYVVDELGQAAEILPQPRTHRQYGGETHTYRFDLLIEVK